MGLDLSPFVLNFVASEKLAPSGFMHLPYVSLVDDSTIRLRDNGLMRCLRVDGLDSMTSDDSALERIRDALAAVIAQLDQRFMVHVHRISRNVPFEQMAKRVQTGGLAEEIDRRWRSRFTRQRPRDRSLTISITRSAALPRPVSRLARHGKTDIRRSDTRNIEALDEVIRFLVAALGDLAPRVLTASSGDLLGFLASIQSGNELPVNRPRSMGVLADAVFNERVTFAKDYFRLGDGLHRERFGTIRVLKNYAAESWMTMFDELALPCDFVISQSFQPVGNAKAAELIGRQRRVMRATDDARISAAEQLAHLHEDILSQKSSLGLHQMSVSLMAGSLDELRDLVSELETVAGQSGTQMVRDALVAKAHYFGQWPGNRAKLVRQSLITNRNFADFASLHRASMGLARDRVPWASPVTYFPTIDGSLRRFNFHDAGSPDAAPSPGHTIAIGKTGTGKSVLAGFLMAQLARLDARIFVFDYRRGLEMITRGLGGSYGTIHSGEATGLNPLQVETDEEGVDWLADWLGRVIKPQGELTPVQTRRIFEICRGNAGVQPQLRRWEDLAKQFASTDDGGELISLVSEWAPRGRFGWVFGKSDEDSFSLDGRIVGFDLTQILDAESARERMAVLSYIFRRVERQLRDARRTVVIIDEAWKALDNPYFAEKLKGWLVTLRKQNAVVLMMTQNPEQLTASRVGAGIYSSFSTQILLPNPNALAADYAPLRLNDKELAYILGTNAGRSFLLRDQAGSTIVNADLSPLGKLVQVIGGGAMGEAIVGSGYRDHANFWENAC
ncbi:VirB4 family type IV secretion system protein [Tropicimonas isoalkanivorans]|uniref:Type IV secretion system protein VirB4 n=1 Tax=Tropicimonas isoalkanivorans TaxID=441112 RepID=A0A1I1PXG3_9RHOB|nr:VirB4 family type IV secretion system protein [Tropicimonas isoalkanivorans]SFD14574.1 type IV secretion system protein VirB4 [Tropicimonas isoalkanivorans]